MKSKLLFLSNALLLTTAATLGGCWQQREMSANTALARKQMTRDISSRLHIDWRGGGAQEPKVRQAVEQMLGQELNVDQAVRIALLQNPQIQEHFEELGIAQADLVQAGLLKNPVLDLSVRIPDRHPSKTYVDFSVADSFFDALLLPQRKRLAQAEFEQVRWHATREILSLAADTAEAYYAAQASRQIAAIRQSSFGAGSASADAAMQMRKAGNITELERTTQRLLAVRAGAELLSAQTQAATTGEKLVALLGLSIGPDDLHLAALSDVPAAGDGNDLPSAVIEQLAIEGRPEMAEARQEIITEAHALRLTIDSRFFSDAALGPEAERETDGQWRIGPTIALPLPLFDWGQAAVPRAQAMLREARQKYAAVALSVRSQARQARARLLAARQRAELYHDQILPLQQELLQQTQLQYNAMTVNLFQLLQAKRDQVDGVADYIEALRDYWLAHVELVRAVGGKLPARPSATRPD